MPGALGRRHRRSPRRPGGDPGRGRAGRRSRSTLGRCSSPPTSVPMARPRGRGGGRALAAEGRVLVRSGSPYAVDRGGPHDAPATPTSVHPVLEGLARPRGGRPRAGPRAGSGGRQACARSCPRRAVDCRPARRGGGRATPGASWDRHLALRRRAGRSRCRRHQPTVFLPGWGCLHPSTAPSQARAHEAERFRTELRREFYADVLPLAPRPLDAFTPRDEGDSPTGAGTAPRFAACCARPHRLPDRRRRDATARRRGLDAQPRAHAHRELPREGPLHLDWTRGPATSCSTSSTVTWPRNQQAGSGSRAQCTC